MKQLSLPDSLAQRIRVHCAAAYPHEACGLLLGPQDGKQAGQVTAVIVSANLASAPAGAFEIDPALILHHQKAARAGGDKIIGHYHSHPDGGARPSARDQAQNNDPALVWLIVQVTEGRASDMKAFATEKSTGKLDEIPLRSTL